MYIDSKKIVDFIKQYVKLGDILHKEGFITYKLDEEQYSCKFHGEDRKKSARYYKLTDSAYCWVCKERWDAFSYIKKKYGYSFRETVKYFVDNYKIDLTILKSRENIESEEINLQKIIINEKKLKIGKLENVLKSIKNEIQWETYIKLVHSFLLLKYGISDQNFEEVYKKFENKIIEILKRYIEEEYK